MRAPSDIERQLGMHNDAERPDLRAQGNGRAVLLFIVLGIILSSWLSTQYVARRFGYHLNLGRPLTVLHVRGRAWPLYSPERVFVWYTAYRHIAAFAGVFRGACIVLFGSTVATTVGVLSLARRSRERPPSSSHGTARWGDGEALRTPNGFVVGRLGGDLLRYAGEGHVLTVAPTRSGKGVSSVIPNLLSYTGSIFITDPKGENFAVTAAWRLKGFGQAVHTLDPFGAVGGEASINPLDLIDTTSPDANDDAWTLADMLVMPETRHGGDQIFWNEEARALLAGLILHVATRSETKRVRTLIDVRALLTLPPDKFDEMLTEMSASAAADGLVARAANRILQKAEKERSGVISTAQSHTHFLDSPRMADVLGTSSFDMAELKRKPTTVYLVLPPERLNTYARWMRLMIATGLLAMTRTKVRPRERVLFLLDEFAHLGKMSPVQRDIGLVGGYGASFWLLVQDLAQLRATYPDQWQTFIANSDVLQAFGTNDWETAEYLSKMTGDATIRITSENKSSGVSRGRSSNRQEGSALTTSNHARRLLLADEVRRLPRDASLLFVRGADPILADRVSYLDDAEFQGRWKENPLYGASSVS